MNLLFAYGPIIAVAALLTLLERRRNPARSDWWINLQAWAIMFAAGMTIQPLFRLPGMPSLIDGAALPFWIGFPIFLVVGDLGEYLFHRAQHRVPLLWAMHSLHHSDPDMSALTTQRHFWADQLFKTITIWAGASLVIAPTPAMVACFSTLSLWNFFTHSRLRVDFGRWSWLINTPAYHRRHHSALPEHYDSNFAALFPVFDVICGSYHQPDGFPPTGLDRAPRTFRELLAWPLHAGTGAPASSAAVREA